MPGRLIPEVAALFEAGKIPRYDADWIKNISPENQMATALKMMRMSDHNAVWDTPKTRMNNARRGKSYKRR